MNRPWIAAPLLVVGLCAALAGCGDEPEVDEARTGTDGPTASTTTTGDEPSAPAALDGVSIDLAVTHDGRALTATASVTNDSAGAVGVVPLDDVAAETDGSTHRLMRRFAPPDSGDEGGPRQDGVLVAAGATVNLGEVEVQELGPEITAVELCIDGAPLPDGSADDGGSGTVPLTEQVADGGQVCSAPVPVPAEE